MQEVYRIEEWTSGDEDLRPIHELRYTVLVEEMGKYADRADHDEHLLIDEEDARSWHTVALDDDGNIAAMNRVTWGGVGFSKRQLAQYDLRPWIDAGLERFICVGERTIVACACPKLCRRRSCGVSVFVDESVGLCCVVRSSGVSGFTRWSPVLVRSCR